MMWTGSAGSGCASVAGSCEHTNGPLVSIKSEEFIDQLSNY